MKTIWKYPLTVVDEVEVEMPMSAEILALQMQHGVPCLWALVAQNNPPVKRRFKLYGTGHDVDSRFTKEHHVGTYQMHNGALVFHLFEIL